MIFGFCPGFQQDQLLTNIDSWECSYPAGGLWGKAKNIFGMGGGSRSAAEEEELLEQLAEEEEDADMMQSVIGSQKGCACPTTISKQIGFKSHLRSGSGTVWCYSCSVQVNLQIVTGPQTGFAGLNISHAPYRSPKHSP